MKFGPDYSAPKKPVLLDIAPARYLAITGHGAPGSPLFQAMLDALYTAAHTIRFAKKEAGQDCHMGPLEVLWRGKPGSGWQLLMRAPALVTKRDLDRAIREKREELPQIADVQLQALKEGASVQMLHIGPYTDEQRTIDRMMEFAASRGLHPHGCHHEIRLSDPRRVPPERLRTILRQPVGHRNGTQRSAADR